MEKIKMDRKPRLKNPYLIAAWPGMGEVAFKAVSHLIHALKAEEFARIAPESFFYLTASLIQGGIIKSPQLPENKFYCWKNKGGKNDLVFFLSSSQPDLSKAEEYSKDILRFAKALKIEQVITFASMPQPIEHTQDPAVWLAATSADLIEGLKKYNFNILAEGQISGMNGLFITVAKQEGFKGICLLGEIPLYTIQIENPKASLAILAALSKILNIKIDFSALLEQIHTIENEINKLLDYFKIGVHGQAPINEEEVERMKKILGQLTKLPSSIKEKIEALFSQAKEDIARANELKSELDKWNVYKDYEDRFLDLFKKSMGGDN